ncbi:MAG: hypothetical protein K9L78_01495 [Victivallales bacterium]|nr:hypothetical protein [Victivallales bacterium]MCF7888770.1 hypothetical protein [Victivallales bacterium]
MNNNGFALVLTLWILAIITTLLITFTLSVNLSIKNAQYLKEEIVDNALLTAAVNRLKPEIVYPGDRNKKSRKKDSAENNNSPDDNQQNNKNGKNKPSSQNNKNRAEWYYRVLGKWYVYIDDWSVSRDKKLNIDSDKYILCIVTAEDAKFDLRKFGDLKKIPNYSDEILQNIKTKIKEEKNFRFTCVPQLLTVNGVYGEQYDGDSMRLKGLKNILTTFSDGKIYANTACSQALALVPELDISTAETIARNNECIYDFKGLKELIGMGIKNNKNKLKKWLKFIPKYFKIKAYSNDQEIVQYKEAVVGIEDGSLKLLALK